MISPGPVDRKEGKLVIMRPMVAVPVTEEDKREARIRAAETLNENQRIGAYVSDAERDWIAVQPRKIAGPPIAITNYDLRWEGTEKTRPSRYARSGFKAISIGTVKTSTGQMELFDCGFPIMSPVISSSNSSAANQTPDAPPGEIGSIMRKAKAGDGFFQTVMAEHYRDGDAVERNLAQAKFWAECACTNREADATNLLDQINKRLAGAR